MGQQRRRQRCEPVQRQRRVCVLIPRSARVGFSGQATAGCLAAWLVIGGWAEPHQPRPGQREAALAAAFPGARIVAERLFLTDEQAARVRERSGGELPTQIYARYLAFRDGVVIGRAYVDTHVVRTKRESLLISLEADGRVRRIDVTAFLEPPEYLPSDLWRQQYYGRMLDDDLAVGRAIRPITGATLTTRAVNEASRRVLALDQVLEADRPGAP